MILYYIEKFTILRTLAIYIYSVRNITFINFYENELNFNQNYNFDKETVFDGQYCNICRTSGRALKFPEALGTSKRYCEQVLSNAVVH